MIRPRVAPTLLVSLALSLSMAIMAVPTAVAASDDDFRAPFASQVRHAKTHELERLAPHWQSRILELVNRARRNHGRQPLSLSSCPDQVATQWAKRMAREEVMDHFGLKPLLRCPGVTWAGENVATGYTSPESLFRAWMDSPGHRENILRPQFTRIGFDAYSRDGLAYFAQEFTN